jgi:hypothetical protein
MSSYIFIVASDATPTLLWNYTAMLCSIRPYKVFLAASLPTWIAASFRLYLRHYCWLDSSSHRTTCGITAHLRDLSHSLCTAHRWAVATFMSSYIFIVASDATPTLLWDYTAMLCSIRPYKVFLAASLPTWIAASCRLYLRHYCRLDSSSHRTTCGITAHLRDLSYNLYTAHRWAVATFMSSYIFIVASMPLPHSCEIMLLWKQYETIHGLSCGILADFH